MTGTIGTKSKTRKMLLQALAGGVVGFLSAYFLLPALSLDSMAGDAVILAGIGLIYAMMGLLVAIGLIAPNSFGAKMLNVEDAEELREQKRILTGSSISMIAIGASFIILVMSGPGGTFPAIAGFAAICASLVVTLLIAVRDWKLYDELMRQVTLEASYLTFGILCLAAWIWCAAAWVEMLSAPTPLAILSMISGGYLLAVFIVSAKRGMLTPR